MEISVDDVRHVARLARIEMSDQQLLTMTDELGTILGHIGKISELDLTEVAPMTHVLDVVNVWGEDVPHDSLPVESALLNAPDRGDEGFRVPKLVS